MKKRRIFAFLALAVCAVVLVWSVTELNAVGDDLQYLVSAPTLETGEDQQPNAQVKTLLTSLQTDAEDWDGIVESYTLTGVVESATLVGDETVQARLNALGPDAFDVVPQYLRFGRLFYPEELADGSTGILLDEQLALALFRVAEPIGRTVTISDVDFEVIGVLRHSKKVGDGGDYAAYVPLAGLYDQSIQLDALQVTARPIAGAGASSVFETDMENWKTGGTMINLGKEEMGALLPLRVLLFVCGCAVFFALLGWWKRRLRGFIGDYRERLRQEYALRLMPRLLTGSLLLLLGLGVLILGAAALIDYIVAPVYTFPEWVPSVLVEWDDISTTFWQVWQDAARLRELRSPELIRIRYFALLTAWFSAGAAVLLTAMWTKLRARLREERRPEREDKKA